MAAERLRRAHAGKNIGKLIDRELGGDDFYKTVYGGFEEESGDDEYETEEEEDDVVDSDFDIDEEEGGGEEGEGEGEEPRQKKKQWLKPFIMRAKIVARPKSDSRPVPKPKRPKLSPDADTAEPRVLRKSTLELSEELRRKREEEEETKRKRRTVQRSQRPLKKLTQEEMLEEAKRTEIENLASLEAFTRLEAEKMKVKERKTVLQGPLVRFHSVSMPLITTLSGSGTERESGANMSEKETQSQEKYCRNFLVFTDTKSFPSSCFPSKKQTRPKRLFCPITGLPAKYIDPLTNTPYATPQAFKIIRNRFVSEEEQKCEKRILQLSSWLEEKKRKKLEVKT